MMTGYHPQFQRNYMSGYPGNFNYGPQFGYRNHINGGPGPNGMHGNFNPGQPEQFVNYGPQTNLNMNNLMNPAVPGNFNISPAYTPNVMQSSSTNDCKGNGEQDSQDAESSNDENC